MDIHPLPRPPVGDPPAVAGLSPDELRATLVNLPVGRPPADADEQLAAADWPLVRRYLLALLRPS